MPTLAPEMRFAYNNMPKLQKLLFFFFYYVLPFDKHLSLKLEKQLKSEASVQDGTESPSQPDSFTFISVLEKITPLCSGFSSSEKSIVLPLSPLCCLFKQYGLRTR